VVEIGYDLALAAGQPCDTVVKVIKPDGVVAS
jgi:hypothetical protein